MNTNLSQESQHVLGLLLKGQADEAERYIEEKFSQRVAQLQQELQALGQERSLLMNTLLLAKLGISSTANSSTPAVAAKANPAESSTGRLPMTMGARPPGPPSRREKILESAEKLAAQKSDATVTVQEIVDDLANVDLDTTNPKSSVGNILFKSPEWEHVSTGIFRYRGPQLDLGKGSIKK